MNTKYNWKSTGPGGCDSHCIEHPCGPCAVDAGVITRSHPKPRIRLDYRLIEDVEVDGIDTRDYPDFVDAFICSATYAGRDMTDEELEVLNDDSDFVYQCVQDRLY